MIHKRRSDLYIHFKELAFKNILSYGASITTITFEDGLNLIAGKNGSGKCLRGNTLIEVNANDEQILDTLVNFIAQSNVNDFPKPLKI